MNVHWFRIMGNFFIPASFVGWVLFLRALVYAVFMFLKIDAKSHSVSDTWLNFAFNHVIIYLVYSFIAFYE